MNKKLLIYLAFIGLIGLVSGCEKDGTNVVMLADPADPTIVTMPNLTLERSNGTAVLEFKGTPVDPGFQASATYFLEACAAGNNFADVVQLFSGVQDTSIKITVSDINGALLKKFDADAVIDMDFRIRAVLVVDAGTGAPGTSSDPFVYYSPLKSVSVTTYGLPRLDLINSGVAQKIQSALGDGNYSGFVKLSTANPFTLNDPDTGTNYGKGASEGVLAVDGTGIAAPADGWHQLNADTQEFTYSMSAYMIGLVGSATANGWNSPDTKMDYDLKSGTWYVTTDLIVGEIKFRLNDGWAWNLGGTPDKLEHNGANIPITEAGNYTITLTITNATAGSEAGTCTIVQNTGK